MRPPVSVIVPVCDSAPWLERCVDSLLAQSLPGLEIILVDDASKDESPALCARYAEQHPGRVRCLALPQRQGPGAARNAGLAQAQGEFLGFVDSDDAAAPEMYAELYRHAQAEKADIVVCGFRLAAENSVREILPRLAGELQPAQLLFQRKMQPSAWNKLFRKSFVDRTHTAFPETYCAEDMAFVFMLMTENPLIYAIAKPLYIYYYRYTSMTADILRRKDTLESLLYIKRQLIAKGEYHKYKYKYAYMYFIHAIYYPLQLLVVRSLLRGENRRMNVKNFPAYAYLCCSYLFKK